MLRLEALRERHLGQLVWRTPFFAGAILATTFGLLLSNPTYGQAETETVIFNIPAQSLPSALSEFARQAQVSLVFSEPGFDTVAANAVIGSFQRQRALAILLEGTGLRASSVSADRVIVQRPTETSAARTGLTVANNLTTPSAQATGDSAQSTDRTSDNLADTQDQASPTTRSSNKQDKTLPLEEIVVTGTHIRGKPPVGAQLIIFNRQAIEQTGFSSTAELIQSLPQALGAGPNIDTSSLPLNVADAANSNPGLGSSSNLRGIGPDSTLTLVNGRRLSGAGSRGGFVDISLVPLTSVERIEIMADGAAALYGSDAIGGVINIVLRDDYEGAETRVQYGTVTSGSHDDFQFGQVFGNSWGNGNMIFAYEYQNQEHLLNSEREYTANSDLTSLGGDDFDLLSFANPGTIFSFVDFQTYAIPEGQDGTSLTAADFVGSAGTINKKNQWIDTTLLPATESHRLFTTVSQKLNDSVELFGELRYTDREYDFRALASAARFTVPSTNPFFVDPTGTGASSVRVFYSFEDELGTDRTSGEVVAVNLALGTTFALPNDWQLDVYGSYDEQQTNTLRTNYANTLALNTALADTNPATAFNPFGDGANTNPATIAMIGTGFNTQEIDSDLWSANATADGTLLSLPGGEAKLAFGMDYREETFSVEAVSFSAEPQPTVRTPRAYDRDIFAAFAEVSIPIFGESNSRTGFQSLDISIAGRFEDYSDFGTTINPRVGIAWAPTSGLTLRGSYSESFRAPLLDELRNDNLVVLALTGGDAGSPTGTSDKLLISGGNPLLTPEEAENWTVGFDVTPDTVPGLSVSATYFNIDIENRIAEPDTTSTGILADPVQFASIITRNPDPAVVQAWFDNPDATVGDFTAPGSVIDVIVDTRLNNVSLSEIRGMDLTVSYRFDTNVGTFGLESNSSYYFDYKEAFTSTAPVVETLDTVNNQVDFRARNSVSWSGKGFAANLFVNYVSDYTDDVSVPNRKIDSWATADFNISYTTDQRNARSWRSGLKTSLIVQNLFDEDPPFVNNSAGVGFDPTNSNPLGRFVSLKIVKDW